MQILVERMVPRVRDTDADCSAALLLVG